MAFNCIVIEDEELARDKLAAYVSKVPYLHLLGAYENPLLAMESVKNADIIFTDIHMPEMDGIAFVESLEKPPVLIFVTGNIQFAAKGYDLDVLDFLMKPYDFGRFMKAANKARAYLEHKTEGKAANSFLVVKDRNFNLVVNVNEIVYIKASKDYVMLYTTEKTNNLWRSLSSMEYELPRSSFVRVHKSFILNLAYVKSISSTKVILKGNYDDIPLGAQFKAELFRRFGLE